jgi:hypothetical protein
MTATLDAPTRLVHRLAARLDPERPERARRRPDTEGRRSFLVRAAVVGAALATNPLRFVLRPGTAYASVCGDGTGCGTGWTVFCCTVNGGANTCPPGSFAAGWWKADGSAFCGGAARYYIDCNRLPSEPGACGCVRCHDGNGTCDQRRYCCNNFRYGQCHLEIGGVTPVVCRVITCTPPWQWDPACSTSPRTDNRTGTHSAPCLPGPGAGAIALEYQDLGMVGSPLGRQVSSEVDAPGGGRVVVFERGRILWRPDLGAHASWGPIHDAWFGVLGGPGGPFGYPTADTLPGPGGGAQQPFEGGSVFWSESTGVHALSGAFLAAYLGVGGPAGFGYPVSGEEPAGHGGRRMRFERGVVCWREDLGAHPVFGGVREKWEALGADQGFVGLPWTGEQPADGGVVQWFTGAAIFWSPATGAHELHEPILGGYQAVGGTHGAIGYPTTDVAELESGGLVARFERGTVTSRPDVGTHAVYGAIDERWHALGGPVGPVGLPWTAQVAVGDGRGQVQSFTGAALYWSPQTGAHDVAEPILSAYLDRGGPTGALGYPVSGTEPGPGGDGTRVRFERGTLVADRAGNVTLR